MLGASGTAGGQRMAGSAWRAASGMRWRNERWATGMAHGQRAAGERHECGCARVMSGALTSEFGSSPTAVYASPHILETSKRSHVETVMPDASVSVNVKPTYGAGWCASTSMRTCTRVCVCVCSHLCVASVRTSGSAGGCRSIRGSAQVLRHSTLAVASGGPQSPRQGQIR